MSAVVGSRGSSTMSVTPAVAPKFAGVFRAVNVTLAAGPLALADRQMPRTEELEDDVARALPYLPTLPPMVLTNNEAGSVGEPTIFERLLPVKARPSLYGPEPLGLFGPTRLGEAPL